MGSRESRWLRRLLMLPVSLAMVATSGGPPTVADLHTGEVLDGGRNLVRESTLDDFPLYLRSGAAIGFNQRIEGVWAEPWGLNDLDRRDRAGWTYAPGTGPTVATSPFGGKLVAHSRNGTINLTVTGAPAETQVMVAVEGTPRRVVIDGRPVAQSLDGAVGWTVRPAPFGGVLLKLSPRHGDDHAVKERQPGQHGEPHNRPALHERHRERKPRVRVGHPVQ